MNHEFKLEENSVDPEFLNDFLLEAAEHIENIEMNLLVFEKESDNTEVINALFRSFHTIKGLAGFVDQTLIQKLAHETETILDKCGKNTIVVTKDVVDLILNSCNFIKLIIKDISVTTNTEFLSEAQAHILKLENADNNYISSKLGEILVEEKKLEHKDIDEIIQKQKSEYPDLRFGQVAVIEKKVEIRDVLAAIRIQQNIFRKIRRIASHTINELGKDIEFITSGDETETNRLAAERLFAPLVHLVKNAIYHGVEHKGTVRINAYNNPDNIYIEVIDDGKGIDVNKVYQKAMEKGLIDFDREYSKKEILDFIMLPGFSTVETVNNIAGRGVGLDVVRTEIQKYGGKVEITTEKGKGTTFTLILGIDTLCRKP